MGMGAIPDEEEAVLARLDAAFAGQRAALSARQVAVVRAWQRTDREYELAQAVARSRVDLDRMPASMAATALEFQQELDDAIETGRLPFDLTVYRGVRSLRRTFGVDDPEHISLGPQQLDGYTASSVLRRVAVEEFTAPGGALMKMALPAGTKALWVAGAGSRRLRRQGELLLKARLHIRIAGHRRESGLHVPLVEVTAR
jgi:hypothetical protein